MIKKIKWVKAMNKMKNVLLALTKLTILIVWSGFCLLLGARYFETGRVPSFLESFVEADNHTGGTILVSGTCILKKDKTKKKGLLRDQLTVYKDDGKVFHGIVRKDKEFVECDRDIALIDTLPLIQNVFKYKLIEVPKEDIIFEDKVEKVIVKDWSFLEKKKKIVSGVACLNIKDERIPNFIDDEILILKVEGIIGDDDNAEMEMVRVKDNVSLRCQYKNVYLSDVKEEKKKVENKKSLLNSKVYVSGRCLPHKTNVSSLPVKLNNYLLKEMPIRVIEEDIENGRVNLVSGVILEENNPILAYNIQGKSVDLPIKGHIVQCSNTVDNPISIIENPIIQKSEGDK